MAEASERRMAIYRCRARAGVSITTCLATSTTPAGRESTTIIPIHRKAEILETALNSWATLRLRARHANSYSGVQGEWQFYGAPDLPPDDNQFARQNNLLGSLELDINRPSGWQHRFTAYDYSHRRDNVNGTSPDRAPSVRLRV